MRLKYDVAWFIQDPIASLRGMSPKVQDALSKYNSELQSDKLMGFSIIPDGNRRFSRKVNMASVVEGHREWVSRIEETLLHLVQNRSNLVDEVTFWWLSRENKERPEEELQWLYSLLREFKPRLLEHSHNNWIHAFMIGDENLLPADIVQMMRDLSEETEKYNSTFRCALALWYDKEGEMNRQADIIRSEWVFLGDEAALRWEAFKRAHKWLKNPAIMIRWGSKGRHRTSGWFMWPNTALHFFRAHWPTISTRHIDFALYSAIMEQINNGK